MGKNEEQTVKKCVLPYHVLIVVVLVLSVFVGIVSAGNVNDETKNSLSSTMAKSQPEEPSSILTITIINETTASCEWLINAPGEFSAYIPYETKRLEENINSLEKGVEDLLLQEVKNTKIIEGNETIILTFDLQGNYTNSFVTGEFRYTYELNEYAPCFLNVLKIVIPQNKTLISVNPGVNAREGNALIYYDYNWIYPLDIRFTEKTHSISVIMGEEWELPKPYLADSSELSEEKGLIRSELKEKHKSRFAEPNLLVGTGGDILDHIPQLNALQIAEAYKPRLYLAPTWQNKCPDKVYYRVIKGIDIWAKSDAYLIQYFAYWDFQFAPPHEYDYEPIFIYVQTIGDRPYRVAYDRCDGDWADKGKHYHQIHRTHNCIISEDGEYPIRSSTNDKAYYPYGKTSHEVNVNLSNIVTSLKNNWDGNHVMLSIAHSWHTFDTEILAGSLLCDYELSPLTDKALINAYNPPKYNLVEPFKYDISDPFKGVFWDDHYHRDSKFPTISGNIKSAVVNDGTLTVKVSMFYDNTGAGGSPGQHLRGLWVDRFDAMISTDTVFEVIGNPKELDEQSPGEYILEFDVSGIDIKNSVLHLEVRDNVKDSKWLPSKEITVSPVEKGLHWLQTQQNPDGSWQNSVGITSMAALAFLNADYTEDDPTVNKAIQYILANQNADRSFGRETYDTASEYNLINRSADRSFGRGTYETSTAIWALIATHNSDYNDEIADAKDWLINAQYDEGEGIDSTNPYYGGWSYGLEPSWADLSNTQFALMALDAANLPKSSDVWAKAITYISRCQNRPASNDQAWAHDDTKPSYNDGGFIYCPEWGFAPEFGETGSYGSITAAGIWSLRLCGVEVTDARVQAGLNWLANNEDCSFDDNPGHPYGQEHCFLYYYYMSLAKALAICFLDDLSGEDWYTALSIKLADLQYDDGYWVNSYTGHGGENIPEIATDFAILALQTKQPPAADLWMSVFLASNATLTVYDPQGRYARFGDITIPGATFEIDGDGRQIVNLTELQAGKYRVELKGTADGDYSLTIEGYRDEEKTSSETFESTVKEGEYQKSDVLVTSMVGALTIIAEEPKDLLVTDLPNVELISADPTVTSINVTGLSLSEINTTYKPAGVIPQFAYMVNSTGAGSFTLKFTDILNANTIVVYKINTTNQWIEILDTTTTANTVTFTMEVGDPPVVFGFEGLPPIANANGPYRGVIEYIAVPITFDGTGSYDPDGTIVKYAWDLDDDGDYDDAFGATPTVSFTAPCLGNIHLKVTDNNGATDTDTTTLTITKHSPPPNGHGGLLTPPEQPQCYSGTSTIQGKGNFIIDEIIQDWATAIDTSEHIEGTGKFEMASKTVLDQAANPLDFYDPNFYYKKTMQFQGNATNRLINIEKFESSGLFGGTGTRINEFFDVSMIQKDESSSIKTISAPGSGQSHRFATMDDFSGMWGIHSDWQKICQKKIAHHQMFIGNFSVQKDLTFEREVIMP